MNDSLLHNRFETDGFCFTDSVIPASGISAVTARMDAMVAGEYETGVAPRAAHDPNAPADKLRKIDQPHLSDLTIRSFISSPEIGKWAAAITGAEMVQVWAVQLLIKPPGGDLGHIGFHQDMQHWTSWFKGEVFTAWVAVTDVVEENGPMTFVKGSHKWGLNENPSFFRDPDHEVQVNSIPRPDGADWEEVPALIPSGAISFHHRFTYHGSRSNKSDTARRSFAIHLRTEKSETLDTINGYYNQNLGNPDLCPVIYGDES
jgi:ectoine hydroxylase-related dioxygenase (phytanoyl-CoA dioxygenase family)